MSKKLYPEENIQAIANAIRAKNGSSDTYTTSAMAEAIEDIPSGGVSVLNGTADPLSGQGEDGQLYLKYGDDPDYVYDETLGGYILKDYLASFSDELLCTGEGRTFSKIYNGSAIAVTWYSGVYYGPILISTVADNIAYSNNTTPLGSAEIDGVTWYITSTYYWVTSLTKAYKPRLNTNYAPDANTVRQAIEAVLEASGFTSSINDSDVVGAFTKVNGTWQNLIGTDIEDIIDTVEYNSNLMIGEFVTSNDDHGIVSVNVGFKPDLLVIELPFGLGVNDTTIATWEKHANWAQTHSVWAIPSEAKTVYTLLDRIDGEAGIQSIKNTGFSFMSHAMNTRNKTCKYVAVKYVGSQN